MHLVVVLMMCLVTEVGCFLFDKSVGPSPYYDPTEPLFLTPYIARGDIAAAQYLSRVGHLEGTTVKSHSGFITVDEEYDSNLFFWFVPAQHADPNTAPTIMWLNGGPGVSSLFGLFVENGPFYIDDDISLVPRKTAWSNKYNVLYVDQPGAIFQPSRNVMCKRHIKKKDTTGGIEKGVGTGFSFTNSNGSYAFTTFDAAMDLYSFLEQFFTMFPNIQKTDFYISGQSYAGKYIPAISYMIHRANPTAEIKMNLKGILIGGAFIDPVSIVPAYGDFMYNIGLLDRKERAEMNNLTTTFAQMINSQEFRKPKSQFSDIAVLFYNKTGYHYYYNFGYTAEPLNQRYYIYYVKQLVVRNAMHVGNMTFMSVNGHVNSDLSRDFAVSVKPWFVALMNSNKYKILLYNGNQDIVVCAPCTEAMMMTMKDWTGYQEYINVDKKIWKLRRFYGDVAGYAKVVGNFTQLIVRGAGHLVPYDQPDRAYDMVTRFIENIPFDALENTFN